ncbi:MAG: glutamine-hydrolyzing GMP synthase [Gammaproteobacteria bacterium]|nr:glutamine-hydrolyzing GMP synthase [Gammaproteobacteria bacterium]
MTSSKVNIDVRLQKILILDFGSQYTQLIARRIREAGVYSEIYSYDTDMEAIKEFNPSGIILSGGPESAFIKEAPEAHDEIFQLDKPILGIYYGMQTIAEQLGGKVEPSSHREFGYAKIKIDSFLGIFDGLDGPANELDVWMSHGDRVEVLPPGFDAIASTDNAPFAAMGDVDRSFYGLQFHPEVTHTEKGQLIIENFVHKICGCSRDWNPGNIIEADIKRIRAEVGEDHVLLGLSGGVDSSVVAALLHQAIGDQLTCIFVDNGLLRLGEADQVMEVFGDHLKVKVVRIDAEDLFLGKLEGVSDPEEKRTIIGNTFIEVFEQEANKIENVRWLAQGTIYPDVIESAGATTAKAHVIKSHHNVAGLPENMSLKLIEPLRDLFKDEVRKIGIELGLPDQLVHRHPFPGPGLGVRILGCVNKEYADLLREADAIFIEELIKQDLYHQVSQAFAVFLPVKSVGVMGDDRKYDYVIALRAVETIDFMTAQWARLPYEFLHHVSRRIINEVEGISRVTYDISSKPPATIEWE